jgi:hypothetical protein
VAIVDFKVVSHCEKQEIVVNAAKAAYPTAHPFGMKVPAMTPIPRRLPTTCYRRE